LSRVPELERAVTGGGVTWESIAPPG
jgi:hypothetical protein